MYSEIDKQYLMDLILFCGIGDGYISPLDPVRNSSLSMEHCLAQEEYLLWKLSLLDTCGLSHGKPYYSKKHTVRYRTERHPRVTICRKRLYRGNKKVLTRRVLRRLTPLGLAIWFCDDGSYCKVKPFWRKGNIQNRPDYKISQFKLYTQSFSEKENENIVVMMERKFGFVWRINHYKNLPYLVLSSIEQLERFKSLLLPIVPDCMRYKLDHPTSLLYSPEETEREGP